MMASLLYGSGLRLMECVRLRVKEVDFGYLPITFRDGKYNYVYVREFIKLAKLPLIPLS
ncbi:MAG TPA: hypothetical protein VIQ24_11895 [Pyrinomonadaceae bacterium]